MRIPTCPHSNTSLNLLLPLYASSCRDRTCLYRPSASLQDVKRKRQERRSAYAWTDGELEELRKQFGKGATLQRYKGLGEMNADQLWETTMNPETRTLIRVTIEDLARAERRVNVLMGDKVEPRRKWIEDNVKFTLEESGAF